MSILAAPVDWTPGQHYDGVGYRIRKALEGFGIPMDAIEGGKLVGDKTGPRGISVDLNLATVAADKILDHLNGKTTYTLVTPNYVALCTGAVLPADTGASIIAANNVEANYTGYARLSMAAADYPAASAGGGPPTGTTSPPVGTKTWPACTASTSVVTNWCVVLGSAVTRGNAGDITFYGTCTSTTISVTQTPPTVAAGGFTLTAT
jgi:hypothetical protein